MQHIPRKLVTESQSKMIRGVNLLILLSPHKETEHPRLFTFNTNPCEFTYAQYIKWITVKVERKVHITAQFPFAAELIGTHWKATFASKHSSNFTSYWNHSLASRHLLLEPWSTVYTHHRLPDWSPSYLWIASIRLWVPGIPGVLLILFMFVSPAPHRIWTNRYLLNGV